MRQNKLLPEDDEADDLDLTVQADGLTVQADGLSTL
jgi:hypothetical protein